VTVDPPLSAGSASLGSAAITEAMQESEPALDDAESHCKTWSPLPVVLQFMA